MRIANEEIDKIAEEEKYDLILQEAVYRSERVDITDKVDRKSTRLNSSHGYISYAVFCLKKKKKQEQEQKQQQEQQTTTTTTKTKLDPHADPT